MEFDDLIEKIFKEVADLLDYKFGKTRGGYLLSNKTDTDSQGTYQKPYCRS